MPEYMFPENTHCYRELGPWSEEQIPEGLQKLHRLKSGSWAKLAVHEGQIMFLWDEVQDAQPIIVSAGEELIIPPEAPHHLEVMWDTKLTLSFYKESET